jgi:hypothetical protein
VNIHWSADLISFEVRQACHAQANSSDEWLQATVWPLDVSKHVKQISIIDSSLRTTFVLRRIEGKLLL